MTSEPEAPSEPRRSRPFTLLAYAALAVPVVFVSTGVALRLLFVTSVAEIPDALRDLAGAFRPSSVFGDDLFGLWIFALAFVATQAIFLWPWAAWRPRQSEAGRWPLWWSTAAAAFVGAAVSTGALLAALEGGYQVAALLVPWETPAELVDWTEGVSMWVFAALLPSWILWGWILGRVGAGPADPMRPERQLRLLLAGSVASVLLSVPFDVLVRRRDPCYCATGTFFGIAFGFAALLWLAGPAILLLLSRRRRLAWRREICLACGYRTRGRSGMRCPECGTEVR